MVFLMIGVSEFFFLKTMRMFIFVQQNQHVCLIRRVPFCLITILKLKERGGGGVCEVLYLFVNMNFGGIKIEMASKPTQGTFYNYCLGEYNCKAPSNVFINISCVV